MKNKLLLIFAVLLNILFIAGCGKNVNTYTYDVKNINHCDALYITKTKYYDDRVEISVKSDYSLENIHFSTDAPNTGVKTKNKTVIIHSDNPENINSVIASCSWLEVNFRYLDSDEYATIWHYWADDLGWVDYSGDKEKYYTLEEQRNQAIAEYKRQENIKIAQENSRNILNMMKGKWISEDGSYFYISDEEYTGSYLLFYDAKRNGFTECPGINFKWLAEDENKIEMYEAPSEGWGAYYIFDVVLSDDKESFEYEEKAYYLADEEVWGNVDIEYVSPIKVLFDNADEWEIDEICVEADEAEPEDSDTAENEETDETENEEKAELIYKYAVTDLDMNGCPEVIVSGRDTDDTCFLYIYETTEDGSIQRVKTNNTSIQPALYDTDELLCFYSSNKYQDVYRYLAEGKTNYSEDTYFIQNYYMSIQINSVVLEKVSSQELIEKDGREATFYDENGNEIKSVDYSILMNHVRDDADKTVNLLWFDDVTIENMAKSFGVFLESMNYEEEE
jgi:hypothetical protein